MEFNEAYLIHIFSELIYSLGTSKFETKTFCRYPQYYAVTKLYIDTKQLNNIENFNFATQ